MFELIVLIVSSLVNILLGLTIYIKNPKNATNRLFLALSLSFVVWSVANYFSLHPVLVSQLSWIRIVMFFAVLLCLNVFLTFDTFPDSKLSKRVKTRSVAFVLAGVSMVLCLTPYVFTDLVHTSSSVQPTPGPAIPLFGMTIFYLIAGGLYSLVRRQRHSDAAQKAQIRIVLAGLAATFGLLILGNFVVVVVFKSSSLIALGPAYTLIFCTCLAYAITRLRLFDIRSAVTLALAYLMLLATLGGLYGAVVFGLTNILFGDQNITSGVKVFYLLIAILIAFTLQPLRRFFDKVSNKLFFRDAYDPQLFLDQLNKNLVSTMEITSLLQRSSRIIEENLKPEFCSFFIKDTAYVTHRNIGDSKSKLTNEESDILDNQLHKYRSAIVQTEDLAGLAEFQESYTLLRSKNIGAIAKLAAHADKTADGTGYMLLGYKKSGNPYSSQDIRLMGIVTNELVIAIQNALRVEEIEQFSLTLQKRVQDATKELRKSNEKLKALDEAKDEFISMASHQLRTPLTSVKGYLSMLAEGDAGKLNETQHKFIDQAFISSQRMVYLIADLLNVSRLKTGKFVIEATKTYLPDVVESEIAQLNETVKSRGLTMNFDKPTEFPTLNLDETKIRQVIMNFADNAIYYSKPGGVIEISLRVNGDVAEFTVTDDGIGVPKAEQPHLFTKFYRAGNARKTRPDGTGLGLFMAKKVVVAQGGALIFKSTEGKGSTFGFRFTVSKLQSSTPQ